MILTDHARERMTQRFPELDSEDAIKRAWQKKRKLTHGQKIRVAREHGATKNYHYTPRLNLLWITSGARVLTVLKADL